MIEVTSAARLLARARYRAITSARVLRGVLNRFAHLLLGKSHPPRLTGQPI